MSSVDITRDLLRTRSREVMAYVRFLRVALESQAALVAKDGRVALPLSKNITHTLKANLLLLLYSAMEATVVQLLDEMHSAIGSQCTSADELNSELFLLVVRSFKESTGGVNAQTMQQPLHQSIFQAWFNDWKQRDGKKRRSGGISGNVDSKAIYSQLKRFGVVETGQDDCPPAHLAHPSLKLVKDRRNVLAHGEQSFVTLGQGLAFEELVIDARYVFRTLAKVVQEVNLYLESERYLARPRMSVAALADSDA